MATYIWDNTGPGYGLVPDGIGPGYGLVPDGTKPLPEPMLTYCQRCSVTFTESNFTKWACEFNP